MMFIGISNAYLISLLYYLAFISVNAHPTIHKVHLPTLLLVRGEVEVDLPEVVCNKLLLNLPFLTFMQASNPGSLALTPSRLTLNVFTESDCKGILLGKSLLYSQNAAFGGKGRMQDVLKFKSFWLSRSLLDQEQLDLSRWAHHNYACGEYITNFRAGTNDGCHNIPNGGTAECVRLWHY